jgi:hypothetical protein
VEFSKGLVYLALLAIGAVVGLFVRPSSIAKLGLITTGLVVAAFVLAEIAGDDVSSTVSGIGLIVVPLSTVLLWMGTKLTHRLRDRAR